MFRALAPTLLVLCGLAHAQAPADPFNYGRAVSYTYDTLGRVLTETVEPDNLPSCVVSTYAYDTWGNRSGTTVANCAGAVTVRQQFATRVSSVNYSATAGLFPGSATNALGQSSSATFDARYGTRLSATDVAGLTATWQVDAFGRTILETRPDATSTATQYCYIAGRVSDSSSNSADCEDAVPADAPADAVMYVHAEQRDASGARMGPYSRAYTDRLGRTIRTVTQGFDGAGQPAALSAGKIVKDVVYSAVGTKLLETQPYYLASGSSTTTGANDAGATLTRYDALGRPKAIYTTDPRGLAGTQTFGTSTATVAYGAYGSRTGAKVAYTYSGQTTTITNDKGQTHVEERNAIGALVRITDPAGGQLAHQHDAFGNLVATKDALQNTITIQYDIRGNRLQLNDPDAGLIKYDYDALGQVVWQENAKQRAAGQSTTMAYDKLGRMTSRTEPEGTGTWSYDKYADYSACTRGAGRLCESRYVRAGTSDTRANKTYYDSLGRATSDVTTVTSGGLSGPTMATARSYHPTTGRLDTKTYPTGLKVQYGYTALGFSGQLKLATAATLNPLPASPGGAPGAPTTLAVGTVLWQAQVVNAWGRTEQQQWSNGVNGRVAYEAGSGRITGLSAGQGAGTNVLNRSYSWDSLNNLTYRADLIGDAVAGAVTETFEYIDGLSRLTKYTVATPAIPGGSRAVSLTYNALGMLLNKSDVGAYTYPPSGPGAVRPHALQSLAAINAGGTTSYTYDANGNLVTASAGKYHSMAYTSFNLPDGQTGIGGAPAGSSGGTANYTWVYDENHQRIKEVRTIAGGTLAGARTTWFLHPDNAGNLGFEYEVDSPTAPTAANPAATNARHYLSFGGQTLGVLVSNAAMPAIAPGQTTPPVLGTIALNKVEYWHKDHLGSLSATTDHAGAVTARYAYDPFGKRRYTNGSYDPFGAIVVDFSPATNSGTDRGFTEHEHLDDIGIIHMNGRLFDPNLGRFLQADRFIQAPSDLQNYNRYAYCLNNPLTCTDPTGFVGYQFYLTNLVGDGGGFEWGHCALCVDVEHGDATKELLAEDFSDLNGVPRPSGYYKDVPNYVNEAGNTVITNNFIRSNDASSMGGSTGDESILSRAFGAWADSNFTNPEIIAYREVILDGIRNAENKGDYKNSWRLTREYAATLGVAVLTGGAKNRGRGSQSGASGRYAIDKATGSPIGRVVVDSKGNGLIEPVGGRTGQAGKGGVDTHTYYPNGSNYHRYNPQGHSNNPTPHGHGHLPGTGPGMRGQGPSLDVNGNVVPSNSAGAHWSVHCCKPSP